MKYLWTLLFMLLLMAVPLAITGENNVRTGPTSALTQQDMATADVQPTSFANVNFASVTGMTTGHLAAIANTDNNPVKKLTHVIASGNEVPIPVNIVGFIRMDADASYYTVANWNALGPPIATAALMYSNSGNYYVYIIDNVSFSAPARGSPLAAIAVQNTLAIAADVKYLQI